MANTGNIIIIERDMNPYSSTYNTTRQVVVQDYVECPPASANYKLWYTTQNGTYTVPCNGNSTVTINDTDPDMLTVSIGSCVTEIDGYAFDFMSYYGSYSKITKVWMADSVVLIGTAAFTESRDMVEITFSNSLDTIDPEAFSLCSSLTSVTLPSSIGSIGERAFASCTGLESVTVNATTPPALGSDAFDNTNNCPIYVPAASVETYRNSSHWSSNWSQYASRIQAIPS